jgi:hypothetical protein
MATANVQTRLCGKEERGGILRMTMTMTVEMSLSEDLEGLRTLEGHVIAVITGVIMIILTLQIALLDHQMAIHRDRVMMGEAEAGVAMGVMEVINFRT